MANELPQIHLDMSALTLAMLPKPTTRRPPNHVMETQLVIPQSEAPSTITDILEVLCKADFHPIHESKAWGDWIHLYGCRTVISIECAGGLCRAATIEHGEGEEEVDGEPLTSILRAFGKLGWHGVDDEGEYPLIDKAGR